MSRLMGACGLAIALLGAAWCAALAADPAERERELAKPKKGMEPPAFSREYRPPTAAEWMFDQAAELERQGKGPEAVKMYVRAARKGYGNAALRLAEIYDRGIPGVARNPEESRKWLHAARILGGSAPRRRDPPRSSPDALFGEGLALERKGRGREAVELYARAAHAGDASAARRLAIIYAYGLPGVAPDVEASRKWDDMARRIDEDAAK